MILAKLENKYLFFAINKKYGILNEKIALYFKLITMVN